MSSKEDFLNKFQRTKSTNIFNEYESSDHKVVIFTFWIDNPKIYIDGNVLELPNYGWKLSEAVEANWEIIRELLNSY